MKPMRYTIPLVLLSFAVSCSTVSGGEPPKLLYLSGGNTPLQETKSPKTVPGYVKKDTWHETLRASLQATLGPTDGTDAAARAARYPQVRDSLWDLVARDFRDRQSQIEMELERRDGIWNEYPPAGNEAVQCLLPRAGPTATRVGPQDARIRGTDGAPARSWLRNRDARTAHRPGRPGTRATSSRKRSLRPGGRPAAPDHLLASRAGFRPVAAEQAAAAGPERSGRQLLRNAQRHRAGVGHPRSVENGSAERNGVAGRQTAAGLRDARRMCRSMVSGSCLLMPITRRPASAGSSSSTRSTPTARACGRSPAGTTIRWPGPAAG